MGMGNLIDFHLERADGKFASRHLTVETRLANHRLEVLRLLQTLVAC